MAVKWPANEEKCHSDFYIIGWDFPHTPLYLLFDMPFTNITCFVFHVGFHVDQMLDVMSQNHASMYTL